MSEQKKNIIKEAAQVMTKMPPARFPQYVSSRILDSDYELNTYWATDDIQNPRVFQYLGQYGTHHGFRECAIKPSGNYFIPVRGKYIGSDDFEGTLTKSGMKVYDLAKHDYVYLRPLIRTRKIDGATASKSFPKWKKGTMIDVKDSSGKLTDVFDVISRTGNVVTITHRIKNTGEEPWTTAVEIEPSTTYPEGIVRIPHHGAVMLGTFGGIIHHRKKIRPATRDEMINAWLY